MPREEKALASAGCWEAHGTHLGLEFLMVLLITVCIQLLDCLCGQTEEETIKEMNLRPLVVHVTQMNLSTVKFPQPLFHEVNMDSQLKDEKVEILLKVLQPKECSWPALICAFANDGATWPVPALAAVGPLLPVQGAFCWGEFSSAGAATAPHCCQMEESAV